MSVIKSMLIRSNHPRCTLSKLAYNNADRTHGKVSLPTTAFHECTSDLTFRKRKTLDETSFVGPVSIESSWAERGVPAGALEALIEPSGVQSRLWKNVLISSNSTYHFSCSSSSQHLSSAREKFWWFSTSKIQQQSVFRYVALLLNIRTFQRSVRQIDNERYSLRKPSWCADKICNQCFSVRRYIV